MTHAEQASRWRKRYNREVEKMTEHYNNLNANAHVATRKPTPEELDFFLSFGKDNSQQHHTLKHGRFFAKRI